MSIIDDDDDEEQAPPNPIYKFIKYSILTVCIMATAYRIYLNYQTYIEYKVIINSKVELSEKEVLPQLSICFYEIINEDRLFSLNETLKDEYHEKIDDPSEFKKWKRDSFTLKTLFDLSFNYADYFLNCTFLAQDAIQALDCSSFYHITLSARKKCFNFFHRRLDESDGNWTYDRILLQNRPWVRIFVKKEHLVHKKKMDVIINPYFAVPNTDKSNPGFKSYTTDYTQSIFVSYDCRISKRLPEPYETKCQDYTKLGYNDRQHCIYECKAHDFLYNNGGWTEDLTVNQSFAELINSMNLTFNYTTDLKSDCETDEKKCRHLDCSSKEYQMINKYHKLDVMSISKDIEVRLYLNSAPTSSLEYEALYPLSNSFVQMFIGPSSLYLGLSIYSISKLVFWFLCEITNRKSKKRKNIESLEEDLKKMNEKGLNNLSRQSNFEMERLRNYDTNFRPFYLNDSLASKVAYKGPESMPAIKSEKCEKEIKSTIDNYYNQLNKSLVRSDSDFASPLVRKGSSVFINPTINNKNDPINSISRLSPSIYKVGLEMYPKKNLKLKKTITEETGDVNAVSSRTPEMVESGPTDAPASVRVEEQEKPKNESWLSKLNRQRTRLMNSLLNRDNHKVYPNLIS